MQLVRPTPAFIPPVIALPAASAAVPAIAGAVATGVSLPVLPLVGAVVVGGVVAGLAALAIGAAVNGQLWGYLNTRGGVEEPGNWYGPSDPNVVANSVVEGQGTGTGYLNPVVSNPEFWSNPYGQGLPRDNATVSTYYQWVAQELGQSWGWTYRWSWQDNGQTNYGYVTAGILGNPATDSRPFEDGPLMQVYWARQGLPDPLPEVQPILPIPAAPPQVVPEPLVEPEPEPARVVPLPIAPPAVPDSEPIEQPRPVPSPVAPPARVPVRPPVPAPPSTEPPAVPGTPTAPNGSLVPTPKPPTTTTPVDANYPTPGAPPLTGQSPRPTPEAMAKELGKLEQKLERMLNGEQNSQKWDLLWRFIEFVMAAGSGGAYSMREPCDPDGDGQFVTIPVDFTGGLTQFGALSNRIDALAELMQAHKDLRQPICSTKPVLTGEWVTVNFQSDAASPGGERPLRKVLRYRDQTAAPLEDHLAHWESFAWDAGPVIVISKNLSWGTPQVWAASVAEGKRVLSHAAQVAGVDLTDPQHEWVVTGSNDPRYGRTGRMRLDTRRGKFMRVTKRPGPSGLPSGFGPDP